MRNSAINLLLVPGLCLTAAMAGCDGGRNDATALVTPSYEGEGSVAQPHTGGIQAIVNNAPTHYQGDMRYTSAGAGARGIQVLSLASDQSYWAIDSLTPRVGEYRCDSAEGGLKISLQREGFPALSSAVGGECQLGLTEASPDRLQGWFRGRLAEANGQLHAVDEGHFSIELAGVIPDLDDDGLADADDNCPFNANPAQADANADGVGDACSD